MKIVSAAGCLLALGALLFLIAGAGCEADTDTGSATQAEIQITPGSATLHKGQSAEFTASGWYEYTWSLASPTWGMLSHKTGKTTAYTAFVGTNAIQVLTCTASIVTTNGSSTVTAEALIQHL